MRVFALIKNSCRDYPVQIREGSRQILEIVFSNTCTSFYVFALREEKKLQFKRHSSPYDCTHPQKRI